MTSYPRPYWEQHLGRHPDTPAPRYPYGGAWLRKFDVFELFVMDGGAFFFTNQHLGGKSTRRFVEAFESGELLRPWVGRRRGAPKASDVDWFAVYDPEKGPWSPGQRIEQHVWLHRMYFLLPMAQAYYRTGHRRWAKRWYEFFSEWRRRFPAMGEPSPKPNPKMTAYIWHDMQVAWRLLTMLHSVFLLGSRDRGRALKPAAWGEVYQAIVVHARWLCAEARHGLVRIGEEERAVGNHLLHKGMALICAGVLYPETAGATEWVAVGRRVVRAHARRDIYRDGGSVEASPSYSHFIAGLHLQAHAILAANRRTPIPGHVSAIRRQYAFLEGTMGPSGLALPLGDSYALDARKDLAVARRQLSLPAAERRRSRCHAASRFAVLRSRTATVVVDAMDVRCGHIHPAKPNVLVFHGKRPVAVDSGCVNYDRKEWRDHFRSWPAHNVVAPEGFLAERAVWQDVHLSLAGVRLTRDGGETRWVCRHGGARTSFVWRRVVMLAGNRVEVRDRIACPRPETFLLWWHWAEGARPGVEVFGAGGKLRARRIAHPAVDERNREFAARTLEFRQTGRQAEFRTVMVLG